MTRPQQDPPRLSDSELGQLPTFGNGMTAVRLEDGSAWVRIGHAIMVRLDLVHWSPTAEAAIKPGSIAPRRQDPAPEEIKVRVRKPVPTPEPKPTAERPALSKRSWSRKATDPAIVEQARVMIEEEGMRPAAVARALGKPEGSIANWVAKYGWFTPALWRRAVRLIEDRGYTVLRAAAAVGVDPAKLRAAMKKGEPPARVGRRQEPVSESKGPGPARTEMERCPHCRQMTHQNPCGNCMEKR